jgi:hypothetical protein
MALVERIEHQLVDRPIAHKPVRCTYFIATADDGARLLQLDTYGSKERQLKGKKSQTIQFSKKALSQLLALIKEHNLDRA